MESIFLFLFSVLICPSSSAAPLHPNHNTLLLRPLPSSLLPPTLSWPDTSDPDPSSPLLLPLHPIDTLSSNLSLSPQSLLRHRLLRDASRVSSLPNSSSPGFSASIISGLSKGSGEYFTRIGIGTPPRYLYMVLDTGSDVLWLQCSPCRSCYNQADPIFNPTRSSSFSPIPCSSPLCRRLDSPGCNSRLQTCLYQVSYGDGSFTLGDFAAETLTFRGTRVGPVALGCGHVNEGLFVGAAGLLGLGRGRLSFPSQAGPQFNNKFSYCLVDRSASSRPSTVIFGDLAASSGTVHYTPLLSNRKLDTFYYVELLGVSVGGTPVAGINSSLFQMDESGNGGVIVDSGTSVTRLTRPAYEAMRDAFREGAGGLKRGPNFSLFDTCYDLSGKKEVKVPTVVLHFRGADVSLPATNYLIPVDSEGTFCFAFAGTMSGLSIIGNIQQQGFRMIFDLGESRVGFVPRGCA